MNKKILTIVIILIINVGCNVGGSKSVVTNNSEQDYQSLNETKTLKPSVYNTSSKRQIKITTLTKFDFPESGPALVMYYNTEIPIDNFKELL